VVLETGKDAVAVRDEDRFDVRALDAWLRERDPSLNGPPEDPERPPQVHQFSGGASNLTYLLTYPDRELVMRRPPPGAKAASAHDMKREFHIQEALSCVYPYVPRMVGLCQDEQVLGSDFYVMERIPGTVLRGRIPPELALGESGSQALCRSAVDRLTELHQIDPSGAGLADLGKGPGYVRRQVEGWSERYRGARTWNVPRFERVMSWLSQHQPEDVGSCVIHGDFRLDNLVLAPGEPQRIVGVLDWEMATIGDPLMDLGAALAYWVQADDDRFMQALRRQPTHAPGMLTRAGVLDRYAHTSGREIDDFTFYEVFGLFRLAVIIQQIYRRYHLRQTRNPAFRRYWLAVRYLDYRCRRIIRKADGHGQER
jgi:aminoglycoside phosphotransferase (APT) family kinase protein